MTTATLDELLAAGQLIVEPKTSLDIPGDQFLTVLRVELAPGAVELDGRTPLPVGPGDVLPIARGHVKSLRNAGDAPFAVLAVLVLDAGKPPLLPALPAIAAALRPPEERSGG